jgi:succinate dehydrogenase / fumarate reductase cytochrome b subunit
MASNHRSTSLGSALRYRGREGMWTWLLHRVTGLGILLFLVIHVVDTALVIYWPELYDHALALYKNALFRVAEVGIFFAVLFHAANGLRIIVQDFWPSTMLRQRQMAWAAAIVVLLAMVPVSYLMLRPLFGGPEPGVERHEQRMRERGAAPAEGTVAEAAPAPAEGL